MRIEDLMSREVVTISPEASLKDVAETLLAHGISGAPVCDSENRVLGVISQTDILRKARGPVYGRGRLRSRHVHGKRAGKLEARTAGEAMTRPAITAPSYMSPAGAAQLMLEKRIHRLPVVRHDELIGIVTHTDLVRAFNRSDEEIAREIREELHWQFPHPAAERDRPTVEVVGGAVVLHGQIERSEVKIMERVIRRVPGVISITSNLAWQIDDPLHSHAAPL